MKNGTLNRLSHLEKRIEKLISKSHKNGIWNNKIDTLCSRHKKLLAKNNIW